MSQRVFPSLLWRQNLFDSIKSEPFSIPEDDGNDLTHTFFNPDREGWLLKLGENVLVHAGDVHRRACTLTQRVRTCSCTRGTCTDVPAHSRHAAATHMHLTCSLGGAVRSAPGLLTLEQQSARAIRPSVCPGDKGTVQEGDDKQEVETGS